MAMLPDIRRGNKKNRINKITRLITEICEEQPIKININKLSQKIDSISLGWILAACHQGYETTRTLEFGFNSDTLDSLAHAFISKINQIAESKNDMEVPKYYDEYDFPTLTSMTQTICYKITPDLARSIISSDPTFNNCYTHSRNLNKIEQEAASPIIPTESLIDQESKKKSKRVKRKTDRRVNLEKFVKHLIENTLFNTYRNFQNAIIQDYLYKGGIKPEDNETYNSHDVITRVYSVPVKCESGEKKAKYKIHYSITNTHGNQISQKPLALTSFKNIFDTVIKNLNTKE